RLQSAEAEPNVKEQAVRDVMACICGERAGESDLSAASDCLSDQVLVETNTRVLGLELCALIEIAVSRFAIFPHFMASSEPEAEQQEALRITAGIHALQDPRRGFRGLGLAIIGFANHDAQQTHALQ